MPLIRLSALATLALLSACGGDKNASEPERKTAAGEVLGGSISDAMLPLDKVQSQSPPLRESPSKASGKSEEPGLDEGDTPSADPSPSATSSAPAAQASTSPSPTPAAEN